MKHKGDGRRRKEEDKISNTCTPISVLFVEQPHGGELATKMREVFQRMEKTVGFRIKVVERSGGSLQSMFPLNNLWDGMGSAVAGQMTVPPATRG